MLTYVTDMSNMTEVTHGIAVIQATVVKISYAGPRSLRMRRFRSELQG